MIRKIFYFFYKALFLYKNRSLDLESSACRGLFPRRNVGDSKVCFYILTVFLFTILGTNIVHGQQLYISSMSVRMNSDVNYCNDVNMSSTDRSFDNSSNDPWKDSALIQFEKPRGSYPGGCLGMCVTVECVLQSTSSFFGVDGLSFEIFKFLEGSNPMDTGSTPPLKTIFLYQIGECRPPNADSKYQIGSYCAAWDGMYNIDGSFGKTLGRYGFRAKVWTNRVTEQQGNVTIEHTSAYPGQNQIPMKVDVTNLHTIKSTPMIVGKITPIPVQPYNLTYRLSKDATVQIEVLDAVAPLAHRRWIVNKLPRVGEGILITKNDKITINGDFWDGRNDTGQMCPPGVYFVKMDAWSIDDYPFVDDAWTQTFQMSLDPLQITDMTIKPLGESTTDVAVLGYMLTEAATSYVEIWTPGTACQPNWPGGSIEPVCTGGTLVRKFIEQQESRKNVYTYWDGRDSNGIPVCDGDYTYAIYGTLPSGAAVNGIIRTQRTQIGIIPINRGYVVNFLFPSSTVIGTTQSVAGLNPFYFKYTPSRDAIVTLNIRDMNNQLKRTVFSRGVRATNFTNKETWDGKDNSGQYVSSGTYLAELITEDPFQCPVLKVTTMTVLFPVDMFRIVEAKTTPLLGGASDMATVSFELSQTMYVDLKVFKPEILINPGDWPWETGTYTDSSKMVWNVSGVRPGRFRITEYWDGRNPLGLLVADGRYPFTLVAHSTEATNAMYATDIVYGYVDVTRGNIIFTLFEVYPTIPTMYNSSDTVKLPPYQIDYAITRQSSVTVRVLTLDMPPKQVVDVISGEVRDADIVYSEFWDGKNASGDFVPPGPYLIRVMAQDISSTFTQMATVQQTIEIYTLRIFDIAMTPLVLDSPAIISYQISEPMKIVLKIYKPGTSVGKVGEVYPPPQFSLVKRIIGIRPSRTQISEYWDGTDMFLAKVPDGNYIFKIYGSTNTSGIDSITGDYGPGVALADDMVIANIPVIKSGSTDICGDFTNGAFFAPNPYEGTDGFFKIWLPTRGETFLKIYNLAGDLIFQKNFGELGSETMGCYLNGTTCMESCGGSDPTCRFSWKKTNSSGKTVSHGIYYAVLRFEVGSGTREVCQTVKKILIP